MNTLSILNIIFWNIFPALTIGSLLSVTMFLIPWKLHEPNNNFLILWQFWVGILVFMLFWRLLAQIGSSRYSIGLIFPCIVLTFFGLRKLMSMGKIYGGILLRWTIYTVFIGSIITLGVIKTARAKSTSKIRYFISLATVLKEEMQGKEPLLLSSNNDGLRILSLVKCPTTCVVKKLPPLEDSATIEQQFKQILERHDQLYLYISNHEKNELFTVFQEVVPRLKWKLLIDTGKNSLYSHQNFSPRMGTEVIP